MAQDEKRKVDSSKYTSKLMHGSFKFSESTNITEVGITGYGGELSESVVFGTPIIMKQGEEAFLVMARRIVELEGEVADLEGSICNMST